MWEEVIIYLLLFVWLVCLLVIVSNVEELIEWIFMVRGLIMVVVEIWWFVRLDYFYMFFDCMFDWLYLFFMVVDGCLNFEVSWFDGEVARGGCNGGGNGGGVVWYRACCKFVIFCCFEVVDCFEDEGMLLVIFFVFFCNGCIEVV